MIGNCYHVHTALLSSNYHLLKSGMDPPKNGHANITEGKLASGDLRNSITDPIFLDEAALYDRQIRLWGMEAQRR
jgi:hypothetical protein